MTVYPTTAYIIASAEDASVLSNAVRAGAFRLAASGYQKDEAGVPATQQHVPTGLDPQVDPDLLPGLQESSSNVTPSSTAQTPPHEPTGLEPQDDPPRLFRLPD